ncbi:Type 1 glutamine amidotransferase-like domain-containing protein [Lactiplantibacillus herbarum]|uniref:Type 1 glutamine amidotransferase-like domain-containing protein n=1 Tax=Lactiplantibacillus herbarum TaxID=1670446 RepID=UPI00064F8E4C|nr:Type 1 glutamine amidotransferase-like domain-containing protein [Lactiplantibacillus herbarum]
MQQLLLSSRAFCNQKITDAFMEMVQSSHGQTERILIIVNSVSEGKQHPKMIELQETVRSLGFDQVDLFDVLTDDLMELTTAKAIILNGGYEFLLLKNLRIANVLGELRKLARTGTPIYGISAGAILLGPDLELFAQLFPEDNEEHLTTSTAINATPVRIYPHYDLQCELNPQLPALVEAWEQQTGETVTRLTNAQGLLICDSQQRLIDRGR